MTMNSLEILIISDDAIFANKVEEEIKQICEKQNIAIVVCRNNPDFHDMDLTIIISNADHFTKVVQAAEYSKRIYIFTKKTTINLSSIKKLFNCNVEAIVVKDQQSFTILDKAIKTAFRATQTVNRIEQKMQRLSELITAST